MVSRCICCNQTFADALKTAKEEGCRNVAELQEHLYISAKCGLCIPYIQQAIETQEAVIPLMNPAESAEWLRRSGLEERNTEL